MVTPRGNKRFALKRDNAKKIAGHARRRETPRTTCMGNVNTWTRLHVSIRMTKVRHKWRKCTSIWFWCGQPSVRGRYRTEPLYKEKTVLLYRTTLCQRAVYAVVVCRSIRPSVRSSVSRLHCTTRTHQENEWMNENARILSAFETRLRAGFV